MGFAAEPSPMKIRMKSLIGSVTNAPVADACGDTIRVPIPPLSSRRDAAATDHANGASAGASLPPREPSHDNVSAPMAFAFPITTGGGDGSTAAAGVADPLAPLTVAAASTPCGAGTFGTASTTGRCATGSGSAETRRCRPAAAGAPRTPRSCAPAGACTPLRPTGPLGPRTDTDDSISLTEAVEPSDPLVSAVATQGSAATAAPTPSATARAPTRPTEVAQPPLRSAEVERAGTMLVSIREVLRET